MAISFTCACGKSLRARDEVAGKKTKCPQCGAIVQIPSAAAAAEDTTYSLDEPAPPPSAAENDEYGLRPAGRIIAAPKYEPLPPRPAAPQEWKPPSASMPAAARPAGKGKKAGDSGTHSILEYSYLLLVFALIPLVVSLLGEETSDLSDRIDQTLEHATPQQKERALPVLIKMQAGEDVGKDELLAVMPEGKLAGAHLGFESSTHWVYAGIASAAFLMFISLCFSVERVNPLHLFLIGLFTGTVGIVFLFAMQLCSQIRVTHVGRGWLALIMLILAFIGWSYRSALDPGSNFFLSAIGFTFGVGLCEEFTKAIPLFFYFKKYAEMGWRGACLWGLASGIGFGVSEGVMYAHDQYNGLHGFDIYLVRFISCVALHAMWSASVGIAIARNVDAYEQVSDFWGFLLFMLRILAVPMILHAFYDTLLKQDMNAWALAVALLSFGWLVMHIEMARSSYPHAGTGKRKFAY